MPKHYAALVLYSMSKPNNQSPASRNVARVPRRPWRSIGIDFVGPLPESRNRNGSFDTICAIIDHLTSMVHLMPTRQTYGARQLDEVILDWVHRAIMLYFLQTHSGNDYTSHWVYIIKRLPPADRRQPNHDANAPTMRPSIRRIGPRGYLPSDSV